MTIKPGDTLPDAEFKVIGENGPTTVSVKELFEGRTIVLFAVPGAFTPTCHANHLPGFLNQLNNIKANGVDEVAVVSVNDMHVMNAWAEASSAKGNILFLADGSAEFTKAIGMENDLSAAGMGLRSQRYSMIVEDRIVKSLNIEQKPGQAVASGAAAILEQLS
ncbi:peroxiredoxin [Salaquimonas pukyongi]|uniref:peroxiredoxin n=1 Tax=Salaquimonas pukyongi TaxID=2712698 RepID=UPI00096B8080|nr:peroxiredoxin [Salaquimonas pukyongi]